MLLGAIFLEPLLPTGLRLRLARHFKDSWPFLVVAPAPLCRLWQAGTAMPIYDSWIFMTENDIGKTIGNDHHLFIIPSHSNGSRKEHALVWLKEHLKPSDIAVVRSGKVRQIPPRRWEVHGSCQCHRQEEVPDAKMVVVSYNLITDPWMQPEETCQNELNVPCSEFERCRSWCGAGDVSYNFSKFHETLHALRSSQLSGWSFQVPPWLLTCIDHLPTCWVSYRLPTVFFPKGAACGLCVASLWVGKAVICCKICLHGRPLRFQNQQCRACNFAAAKLIPRIQSFSRQAAKISPWWFWTKLWWHWFVYIGI